MEMNQNSNPKEAELVAVVEVVVASVMVKVIWWQLTKGLALN
jgi:hypothetical protein